MREDEAYRLVGLSSSISLPLPFERLDFDEDFVAGGNAEDDWSVIESRSFGVVFALSLDLRRALDRRVLLVDAVADDEAVGSMLD